MIAYIMYVNNFGTQKLLLDTENGINKGITAGSFELTVNEIGSLEFTMVKSHPCYDDIKLIDSTIALQMKYIDSNGVTQDMWWPFVGRPTSIRKDMYGNMQVTCESAVGYLNDVYVVYYDYKFTTFYDLLHHVIPQYNTIKEKTHTFYSNVPSTWRKIDYERTGSGDQSAFEYNKDYDKENKNESAIKVFDLIKDQILDAYGGTLYFIYYPNNGDYKIRCGYYGFENLWHGFDYSVSYNVMPHYGIEIETPRWYPRFSIDENIMSITEEPIKNGIYTGILPIGNEAIFSEEKWIYQSSLGSNEPCRDRIVKAVQFDTDSVVKAEDESEEDYKQRVRYKLDEYSANYISRFYDHNYFANTNYTINAIEPCEGPGDFTLRKIVKPCYMVDVDTNGRIDNCIRRVCISIKHDLFNIQNSEYIVGDVIPNNIINEDISRWR